MAKKVHEITSEFQKGMHEAESEIQKLSTEKLHELSSEIQTDMHEVKSEIEKLSDGSLHETTSEPEKNAHEKESDLIDQKTAVVLDKGPWAVGIEGKAFPKGERELRLEPKEVHSIFALQKILRDGYLVRSLQRRAF